MERGWDPEVKKYFKKVLNSLFMGLLWLMSMVTAGIYFQLAYREGIITVLFYVVLAGTLGLLLYYYYLLWRNK